LRTIKAKEERRRHLFCVRKRVRNSPRRVAVVDDDAALRAALVFSLETQGFQVAAFESAEAALAGDLAGYDCIVLDQRLPKMSGLDLVAALRARGKRPPSILITSHPSAAVRDEAREAGVQIVEKPLLGNTLVDRIRSVLAG
jgi:FixJ family two-component response regulator